MLGTPVELLSVCSTSDNLPLTNWQQRIRMPPGGITLTITTPASLVEMFTLLSDRVTSLEATTAALQERATLQAARSARQTAGRILSLTVGSADLHRPAGSTDWWKVKDDPRVSALAVELGLDEGTMREQFDSVIQRRNEAAHTAPLTALDLEVEELMLQMDAALRAICKWECVVLSGYDRIKQISHVEFA